MPNCIVSGCKSGYTTCKEKRHFFRNMQAAVNKQWAKAVGREVLSKHHYVCDKHFRPEDIMLEKLFFDQQGKVVARAPYVAPRVKPDAIPTLLLTRNQTVETDSPNCRGDQPAKSVVEHTDLEDHNYYHTKPDDCEEDAFHKLTFDELFKSTTANLPLFWSKTDIVNADGKQAISFSRTVTSVVDGIERSIAEKELIVKPSMQFLINVAGKRINVKDLELNTDVIATVQQLEDHLELLSSLNLCPGYDTDVNIGTSVSYRDITGVLRHNDCEILLLSTSRCVKCTSVKKNVEKKLLRLEEGDYKRTHFSKQLSLVDQKKIQQVHSKLTGATKKNKRLQHQNEKLKEELKELRRSKRVS